MNFLSFLASWLGPNAIKNRLHEHHCIIWRSVLCICFSATKCIQDDITICWCLMLHDFPPRITDHCNQTANKQKVCCSDDVQNDHGWSLVTTNFQYTAAAAVNFILQFVQTNSAEHLMLNSHSVYCKQNSCCYLSPGGATLYKKSWIWNQQICSAENVVQLCQKSWKLVQAFWRRKQKT